MILNLVSQALAATCTHVSNLELVKSHSRVEVKAFCIRIYYMLGTLHELRVGVITQLRVLLLKIQVVLEVTGIEVTLRYCLRIHL